LKHIAIFASGGGSNALKIIEHFKQNPNVSVKVIVCNFGGKGMYGQHIHKAVKAAGESHSGLTIHYVDGAYDEGNIILQRRVAIDISDTPEDIATKVLKLEHRYYPIVIEDLLEGI